MIRMEYDRGADALSVRFRAGTSSRTVRVSETVAVDLDAQGRIVALEVMDAAQQIPAESLEELGTQRDLMSLAEAEKESGLRSSTLRVLLNKGRLQGEKRGRDWYVDATDLVNYLESREPRGRPAVNPKARQVG